MIRHSRLLLLLFCLQCIAAVAQSEPVVEVTLGSETVLVGEAVELDVTLLVPTWFTQPPDFPTLEIANAITRRPPDSSYPTSRRVGSDTWSGIVRSYRIYPLTAARFELAGQAIAVRYANPGKDSVSAELKLPAIAFTATVPAGAEALDPYIAGTRLILTRNLENPPQALAAGDAVVVVYSAELTGLPAIFLPTLAPSVTQAGVATYADSPVVEEGPPARRTERITVVFEGGGEFILPGVELRWWNTASSSIETVSVAPLTLSVAGPPVAQAEVTKESAARRLSPTAAVTIVLLLALVLWRVGPALYERWKAHRRSIQASEAAVFSRVSQALHGGDLHAGHAAVMAWLPRLAGDLDLRQFASHYGDAALMAQVEALLAALYAPGANGAADSRQMVTSLGDARRRFLASEKQAQALHLPRMNP